MSSANKLNSGFNINSIFGTLKNITEGLFNHKNSSTSIFSNLFTKPNQHIEMPDFTDKLPIKNMINEVFLNKTLAFLESLHIDDCSDQSNSLRLWDLMESTCKVYLLKKVNYTVESDQSIGWNDLGDEVQKNLLDFKNRVNLTTEYKIAQFVAKDLLDKISKMFQDVSFDYCLSKNLLEDKLISYVKNQFDDFLKTSSKVQSKIPLNFDKLNFHFILIQLVLKI